MASDNGAPKVWACPTCGKEFDHPGKVLMHRVSAHGYRKGQDAAAAAAGGSRGTTATGRAPSTPKALPGEAEIDKTVRASVGYIRGGGGLIKAFGAAHLGTTIMGVEVDRNTPGAIEEDGRWWIVRSRAVMAQPLLIDQAKRDVRVYQVFKAFNQFCEGGTALEVGGSLVAATAVDVGVPVGIGFQLGPVPIQPIPYVIGDVLQYVAAERELEAQEQQQQPQSAPAQQANSRNFSPEIVADEPVQGGVEAT